MGLYSHSGDSYNCPGETIEDVKSAVIKVVESERGGITCTLQFVGLSLWRSCLFCV
jgi:hypothetical protein